MTHKLQIGDCIHMPYLDNPSRWWHGTVFDIQGGDVYICGEADLTPPDPRMVVYRCPTSVVTREVPKCFTPINPVAHIHTTPPDVAHLSSHKSKRERRRNRKQGRKK